MCVSFFFLAMRDGIFQAIREWGRLLQLANSFGIHTDLTWALYLSPSFRVLSLISKRLASSFCARAHVL